MDTEMILVLDVGTWQVRAFLAAVEGGGARILEYGCVPSDGFEKGEVTDADALSRSMRQAVSCALGKGVLPKKVFIGVNGLSLDSSLALGSLSVKGPVRQTDLMQLEQAAALDGLSEDRTLLQAVAKQYRVDGYVSPMHPLGKEADFLEGEYALLTARAAAFEAMRQAATRALERSDAVFVPSIFALHELLRRNVQDVSYLLLDIGAGTIDFILYENKNFIKAGSLPLGGAYVTRDVMAATELDAGRAERLKRYFAKLDPALRGQGVVLDCSDDAAPDRNVQYDFLYDVVDSRVRELTVLLREHLSIDLIDRDIQRIYLVGGCANLYSFAAHLEALFKLEVKAPPVVMPQEYEGPETISLYALARYAAERPTGTEDADTPEAEEKAGETILDKIKNLLRWR